MKKPANRRCRPWEHKNFLSDRKATLNTVLNRIKRRPVGGALKKIKVSQKARRKEEKNGLLE